MHIDHQKNISRTHESCNIALNALKVTQRIIIVMLGRLYECDRCACISKVFIYFGRRRVYEEGKKSFDKTSTYNNIVVDRVTSEIHELCVKAIIDETLSAHEREIKT